MLRLSFERFLYGARALNANHDLNKRTVLVGARNFRSVTQLRALAWDERVTLRPLLAPSRLRFKAAREQRVLVGPLLVWRRSATHAAAAAMHIGIEHNDLNLCARARSLNGVQMGPNLEADSHQTRLVDADDYYRRQTRRRHLHKCTSERANRRTGALGARLARAADLPTKRTARDLESSVCVRAPSDIESEQTRE